MCHRRLEERLPAVACLHQSKKALPLAVSAAEPPESCRPCPALPPCATRRSIARAWDLAELSGRKFEHISKYFLVLGWIALCRAKRLEELFVPLTTRRSHRGQNRMPSTRRLPRLRSTRWEGGANPWREIL